MKTYSPALTAAETVMTYSQWEKIRKRKQAIRVARFMRILPQKLCGITMEMCGIAYFLYEREVAVTVFFILVGTYLILTRKRIMQ